MQNARKEVPLIALMLATAFGLVCTLAAGSIIFGNRASPDEFGLVTPAGDNRLAWLVFAVAVAVLALSFVLTFREIRRRTRR